MASKSKLTVIIPCKNEEKNIAFCIESIKNIADELLVADSGSTDKTKEMASKYGAKIIEREYKNSADFKNWAIPQAKHEWILLLDADERATSGLTEEIKSILSMEKPPHNGYNIYRRNYLFGIEVKHSWGKDKVIRLFRRDVSRYKDMRVHSEILLSEGNAGFLKGKLLHYTYWNYAQIMEKYERYTTWAAEDLYEKGKKPGFFKMTFTPVWRFFRQYILQGGFLDGKAGFVVCGLSMYYVFLKYAKLWKIYHGKPQPEYTDHSIKKKGGNSSS